MDSAGLFAPEELFYDLHPGIANFEYSWSIVSDPKKAESVEGGLKEILSGHSDPGLDTIAEHIAYEEMQSSIVFGSMRALSQAEKHSTAAGKHSTANQLFWYYRQFIIKCPD